ncbi:MAG TPA: hypothetical protein VLQ48_17025 [Chloroflexia bacterium]|nr:hypothetical protein [Chloroflexia bacterium]
MRKLAKSDVIFLLVTLAFIVYGLIFIYTTSFVINGVRYFSLFDDAMISMRYARNLADGFGLVWNPGGPPVEGYTNPLWVLFMALWHFLPISAAKMSLAIQLSALALLTANLFIVRKIALLISNGSQTIALTAVIFTAFYLPLNNWSLQGMEVAAITPLVSLVVLLSLNTLKTGRFSPLVYLLLGIGTLLRLDMALIMVVTTVFMAFVDRQNRRSHLLWGLGSLLVFIGAQTLFRWLYYGYPLPNTYYLKVEGFPLLKRLLRGFYVTGQFMSTMSLTVFLGAFAIVAAWRDHFVIFLTTLVLVQVAYSVYVGGDAWEWWGGSNRFVSIVMPLFFVLLAGSVWLLFTPGTPLATLKRKLLGDSPLANAVSYSILVALMIGNAIYEYAIDNSDIAVWLVLFAAWILVAWALRQWTASRPNARRETAATRAVPMTSSLRVYATLLVLALAMINLNSLHVREGITEWLLIKPPIQVHNNPDMVRRALTIRQTLQPDASYAVVWAGIIPYFADGTAVDLLGKSDTVIAHEEMHDYNDPNPLVAFYPGHMKYDYAYSVGRLQPDAIVQFWSLAGAIDDQPGNPIPLEARPYVEGNYVRADFGDLMFYLRKDSTRVNWDVVQQSGKMDTAQP